MTLMILTIMASMMRTMMEVLLTTVMAWPGCLLKTHSVWSSSTKLTEMAAQHRAVQQCRGNLRQCRSRLASQCTAAWI